MEQVRSDITIIGTGLGATAIVHRLRSSDARIVMVPGVGCARFKHLDGGLITPDQLSSVFGTSENAPLHATGKLFSFQREQLEAWAIDQVSDRVEVIDDFADLGVVPHKSGNLTLLEESGRRKIVTGLIVLTEGASPRIGIAARIRPDFEPEELLHFGRALLPGVHISAPVVGNWRTSWTMPGWYSTIPHPHGVIVSASARIENIMRSGRDGRDTLRDFLESAIAADIGLAPTAAEIGMELVPLRSSRGPGQIGTYGMISSPDANGTVDPRRLDRFARVLQGGAQMGDYIGRCWPQTSDWTGVGSDMAETFTRPWTPYHDSSETGYIEEGEARSHGLLRRLLKR